MYRVTLGCRGISPTFGGVVAEWIQGEFLDHRPWHRNVTCRFVDGELVLEGTNDFDETGLALADEFSDCISAYVPEDGYLTENDGDLRIVSVEIV